MYKLVTRMRGGLGNQLFILSYALFLQKKLKEKGFESEILLDLREYETYKTRSFELLDVINDGSIRLYSIEKHEIKYELSRNIYHILQRLIDPNREIPNVLRKHGFYYSKRSGAGEIIANKTESLYLYGYFQDVHVVNYVEEELIKRLNLKESTKQEVPSIAVSIRCGKDYRDQGWPICTGKYFVSGIEEIINEKYHATRCRIVLFTDDIEMSSDIRSDIEKIADVTLVTERDPFKQLQLMKECEDFVISNSSFAWWGAYLGRKKDSIVIIPSKWYDDMKDTKDTLLLYSNTRIRDLKGDSDEPI